MEINETIASVATYKHLC